MREAIAVLIPACAIGVFLYPRSADFRSIVSSLALAFCLGIGFSSLVSLALIIGGIAPTSRAFVLIDVAIWIIVAVLGWRIRRVAQGREPRAQSPEPSQSREPWLLPATFSVIAIVALASAVASSIAAPHGDWDAWAIWNQHARFLFRGGDGAWRDFFSIEWSQPDYPLLLPASVARVWAYAGHESTLGPILIAIGFGIACVTLVVTTLDGQRGWIAGALLLGATTFLTQVPAQCADVPLACFIVATLAVTYGDVFRTPNPESRAPNPESRAPNPEPRIPNPVSRAPDPGSRIPALVAGATSAMAAWTKNEGVVFVLLVFLVAVVVAVRRRDGRQLLWSIAGAAPILIAVVWFKLALAPSSGLVEGQSLSIWFSRLMDIDRHVTVLGLMVPRAMRWSAPIAVAIFPIVSLIAAWMAIRVGGAVRVMASVLGLMLASYYLVYVTTPFDITWHVSTSIDRLLVQLWPAFVLTMFLGLRSLDSGLWASVSHSQAQLKTLSKFTYFRLLIAKAVRSYSSGEHRAKLMAHPAVAVLESALRARKLDRTLTTALPTWEWTDAASLLPMDMPHVDACLRGGLPRGHLSELSGPCSSGRMTLLLQFMAAATQRGEIVALVDTCDRLDVASAAAAGVDLDRLLWVRGSGPGIRDPGPGIRDSGFGIRDSRPEPKAQSLETRAQSPETTIDRALKALNLVLQAGGFSLVAIDLADVPPARLRQIPFTTWPRVQRVIEGSDTACVLLTPEPLARSAGGLTLSLTGRSTWAGISDRSRLLQGADLRVRVVSPRKRIDGDVRVVTTCRRAGLVL
jgi:hypothetical protein